MAAPANGGGGGVPAVEEARARRVSRVSLQLASAAAEREGPAESLKRTLSVATMEVRRVAYTDVLRGSPHLKYVWRRAVKEPACENSRNGAMKTIEIV
eukprot:1184910-Prorocentrum_minimum.AAC.1